MKFSVVLSSVLALAGSSSAYQFAKRHSDVESAISSYSASARRSGASSTYSIAKPAKTLSANESAIHDDYDFIKPQAFIINMFSLEQEQTFDAYNLTQNITIPGLSPVYPEVHCNDNYTLCQVTTGEAEANAASTISALTLSPIFDLSETYFLIAGISGISPKQGSIGDVTFPRFAVQILEYEVDAREMPENWTTGYFPLGTTNSSQYPVNIYGTEVFELNVNLRDRAVDLVRNITLDNGAEKADDLRETYEGFEGFEPATKNVSVLTCDTLTGDTYWFGELLDESFANYTSLITNGSATYCTTQQEDNASLESFIRAAQYGLVDFGRIVILRTASDYTYSPNYLGDETTYYFNEVSQDISPSLVNLGLATKTFIDDILFNWEDLYSVGAFEADNYLGDYFNSLDDYVEERSWGNIEWGTA
ncbi:nucleoside protein [[Candida] boidinii]|uniref:Unnamed protein product n=1 Tax=Candida boidinii TaxID=5477 RepID=A0ACB5TLG3_CANBO|nr:nucleoside protein [[Candida] boidinii]OWB61744.1 nucleoside protein [[Candida] boidinii]OWB71799.1 nucleoside protein [[Candida] boidinii]GME90594.1 unnamed protein product [[Candida] boidinii]